MDDKTLEAMERDLAVVSGRIAAERSWDRVAPRVRRALRRPWRSLAWTSALILATAVQGFWTHHTWMVTVGLLLAVLPDRIDAVRRRRRRIAMRDEDDLFAMYAREVRRRDAGHFISLDLRAVEGAAALAAALVKGERLGGTTCLESTPSPVGGSRRPARLDVAESSPA